MARLTRQELRKDELSAQLGTGLDFLMQHRRPMLKWIGYGAAAVVVALGVTLFLRSRDQNAAAAFGTALETYHAPVNATPAPDSKIKSYKNDTEKFEAALKEFNDVAGAHGGTSAGRWAKYYAALSQQSLAKYGEAEKQLQEISGEGNADFRAVAKLALAGVLLKQDKDAEGEKILKELEQNPTDAVPKITAQLALADLYRLTNPTQARTLYQEISKEYPETSLAEMAAQRLQDMPTQ